MTKIVCIKKILFASFIFCGSPVFSQDKQVTMDNEQDKKYTPNASSIFNTLNKKKEKQYSSDITINSLIKFCPTMAVRQKIMFYYERQLTDNITVNAGLGKAFGDDVFQRSYFALRSFSGNESILLPYDILDNGKFDRSSPTIYLGGRVYFSSTVFDEGFIELAYRYEKMEYLLDYKIKTNSNRVDGSNRASFKMHAFSFGYGFIEMVGPKNNFCHEVYVNFGVKTFKYSEFEQVQIPGTNGSSPTNVYQKSGAEQKTRIIPAFNFGYCFGFGF